MENLMGSNLEAGGYNGNRRRIGREFGPTLEFLDTQAENTVIWPYLFFIFIKYL